MINSSVLSNVIIDEDGRFGIQAILPSGTEKRFESLFADRCDAEELSDRINRLGVSECHLDDIIEDNMP